jgi:hypothetical protein
VAYFTVTVALAGDDSVTVKAAFTVPALPSVTRLGPVTLRALGV